MTTTELIDMANQRDAWLMRELTEERALIRANGWDRDVPEPIFAAQIKEYIGSTAADSFCAVY